LNKLVTSVAFYGVHEIVYQDRTEIYNGQNMGYHPALIKEPLFSNQHELRAIWVPNKLQLVSETAEWKWMQDIECSIEPVVICHKDFGKYCKKCDI